MSIVIYPPTIDWDYMRQRPQQLMAQFAKNGHIVLYFNKNSQEGPIVTEPHPNLYVIHQSRFFLDTIYPLISDHDKKLYWSSWSKMIPMYDKFDADFVVYDCVDDFPEWEKDEKQFSNICNVIVCTADKLEDKMRSFFPDKPVYKIPNGCDWNYFSTLLTKPITSSSNMRIGYIGAWAPWVDAEIVRAISEAFPSADINILGPDLRGDTHTFHKNVHFFGHVPYKDLLDHLSSLDILILPFALNRITESTNPIKIYEYLSTGKPVVSTNLPEVRKLAPMVNIAEDIQQFIDKIKSAYALKDKGKQERSDFAKQFSWEERYRQISTMLDAENKSFAESIGTIKVNELIHGYTARSIPLDYCTVNSYYKDQNLSSDPIFVGRQGDHEYQCYFKSKQFCTDSEVVRVYLELTFDGEFTDNQLVLSMPLGPWYSHQLTYENKPEVEGLNIKIKAPLVNTLTFDVTEYVQQNKISMFHLQSETQNVLRFSNPVLTYIFKR